MNSRLYNSGDVDHPTVLGQGPVREVGPGGQTGPHAPTPYGSGSGDGHVARLWWPYVKLDKLSEANSYFHISWRSLAIITRCVYAHSLFYLLVNASTAGEPEQVAVVHFELIEKPVYEHNDSAAVSTQ